jgi:hypothetical protein
MITTFLALVVALFPVQAPNAEGVRQLFDNERVTVSDATLAKGKPAPVNQHPYDTLYVDLAAAAKNVASAVGFWPKGSSLTVESTSDTPKRLIKIELKDIVVPPLPNNSGYVDAFPREGSKKILENSRVTIWELPFTVGKPTPTHFHGKDVVVVYLANGETLSTAPDGKATPGVARFGEAKFNPRNRTHSEMLVKGEHHVIAVELK